MKQILFSSITLCITLTLSAMRQDAPSEYQRYSKLNELPAYCTHLMQKLSQTAKNSAEHIYLPLAKRGELPAHGLVQDCELIEAMTQATRNFIDRKNWWLVEAYQTRGFGSEVGIRLHVDSVDAPARCSLPLLLQAYQKIVTGIQKDWKQTSIKNYPNLLWKKDESEWALLVRENKETFDIKPVLQAYIAAKLSGIASADVDLIKNDCQDKNLAFVWINKKYFERAQSHLQLSIE